MERQIERCAKKYAPKEDNVWDEIEQKALMFQQGLKSKRAKKSCLLTN